MNFDILVPISFFIVLFATISTAMKYRARRRRELHQTLRVAVQSGGEIPPATLKRLASSVDPRRGDLRTAIVFAVMTVVLAGLSWLLPFDDRDAQRIVLCIAVIPAALAMTYLAFWRFWYADAPDGE